MFDNDSTISSTNTGLRVEFFIPTEQPFGSTGDYVLDLMDIPHLGAHKIPLSRDYADWDGQAFAGDDDHHERAYYTIDQREPSYLDMQNIEEFSRADVEALAIEQACKAETQAYMDDMADEPDNTLRAVLMHSVLMGDLTLDEADRFYIVVSPDLGPDCLEVLEPQDENERDYDEDRFYEALDFVAARGTREALDNHAIYVV